MSLDSSVAIVGLAGRFPGAQDAGRLWHNLVEGHVAIRFPTEEESLAAGVPPHLLRDSAFIRAYADADDIDMFDAELFGFTPRDAKLLDPQIRMFLEVAHGAVENAGYDPYQVGAGMGVYATVGANAYLTAHLREDSELSVSSTGTMAVGTLSCPDFVATHLSYRFGFQGPSLTLMTACSSSALAVHLACQALRLGDCDMALAGGAEAELPLRFGYRWDSGSPMSSDGHCRPFDRQASGTVFGSGAGAVLLKRLDDAVADGDHIWAVLRGTAVNNDGSAKAGFSAPGLAGQAAVIEEAMRIAEVKATDMSYVEAHATGTILGDPVEIAALAKAYAAMGSADVTDPIVVSSIKGNIGHMSHAAGVTSLIKMALSLVGGQRPGTGNFSEANPRLKLEETPFEVTDRTLPWPRVEGGPRVAGVSSLGIGGTNVHMIVAEGPEPVRTPADGRPRLMVWSGTKPGAVTGFETHLATHLRATGDAGFADTVATLAEGRTPYPLRAALVAADAQEALDALAAGTSIRSDEGPTRPVVFCFPGQAAQQPAMATGLYQVDAAFTRTMDEVLELFAQDGPHLRRLWLDGDDLTRTQVAQPLLFAVEYALAAMWRSWGIEPAAVVGHSLGELTAAAVAGVMELKDAVRLVSARAEAMGAMPPGSMVAVAASPEELGDLPDGVTVAVVNGTGQTVLAGPDEAVADAVRTLTASGRTCRPLPTSHAFHSPMMAPAEARFEAAFGGVALAEPAIPMVSAATGLPVGAQATDPRFWAGQVTAPVHFDLALEHLVNQGDHVLLEVGPGQTLTSLARDKVRGGASLAVPTLPRAAGGEDARDAEHRAALTAAATLWAEGHTLNWPALHGTGPVRRIPMPGYPYQRDRHWIERKLTVSAPAPVASVPAEEATRPVVPPFSTVHWVPRPRPSVHPGAGGLALALLPQDGEVSLPAVLALQQAGYRLAVVRPGAAYAESGGEFTIRPDRAGDLDQVLDVLAARGQSPRLLVHALTLDEWERPAPATVAEQLEAAFHSLLVLAQRGTHRNGPGEILVLTRRSVDVTGAEPVDSVKACLHGLVRTLGLEHPELRCRLVDLAGLTSAEDLAAEIRADGEAVVALRGPMRWVRIEEPYSPDPAATPTLRRDGVYVLTGGLGGLGLAVARSMAGTGLRPHLVLVGRRGPEERLQQVLATLESLGARVHVEQCDLGDRRATRRLFDTIRARLGSVHGVIHLAGVAGDGMLALRTQAEAEAVLRPKVAGTLHLEEALGQTTGLDFFVAFSSRAALNGLAGGGDYAAANAFQDAHMRLMTEAGIPAYSLNWPSWHTVGMAAVAPPPAADRSWETVLDARTDPFLDEHRLNGIPVLPGTGHLDMVTRAFRQTFQPTGAGLRVEDVVFQRPLAAPSARRVHVAFTKAATGWQFVISSVAADAPSQRSVHSTGRISADVAVPRPDESELAALMDRLNTPVPPVAGGQAGLVQFGPRWSSVERITVGPGDTGERLIHIAYPQAYRRDLDSHPVHPVTLDCATAEALIAGEGSHLPFSYGSLEVYAPFPARLVSHIRCRAGAPGLVVADVDLYATDGRLLARIEGFVMRSVTDGIELGDVEPSGPEAFLEPGEGIAPQTGADLFLSLLGGRHPYQVAIRPYRYGQPLPLATTSAASAAAAETTLSRSAPVTRPPVAAEPPMVAVPGTTPEQALDPVGRAGDIEGRLAALWTSTLGIAAIGPDDDFFELGGNSLTAVELMGKVRQEFGVGLGIVAMFDHPTLGTFAEVLREEGMN